MEKHEFQYVDVKECHGKFKLYVKSSGYYVASFSNQEEAVKVANKADQAIRAKRNEQLVIT